MAGAKRVRLELTAEDMRNLLPPIQHEMSNCIHPHTSCRRCLYLAALDKRMTDTLWKGRARNG